MSTRTQSIGFFRPWGLVLCLTMAGMPGLDAGTVPGKAGRHLFDPTPKEQMRELSTDRPDKTESAYTVDAGHFQFEMDVLSYTRDRDTSGGGDTRATGWAVAPINLKAGLLNNVDLQVVLETYNTVRIEDRSAATPAIAKASGFGDITTRVKINLWGNDGGRTAFAIMPFVKFPTNQNGLGNEYVEGGVIFPLAVELSGGWGMGLMTEIDVVRNSVDDGYTTAFINTITFSHDIAGRLGGYVEFFSEISAESGTPWIGIAALGFTYAVSADVQLDGGINVGITRSADDVNPFLGLSWRY